MVEVREQERVGDEAPPPSAAAARQATLARGLDSARAARSWLRSLGEIGIAVEFVVLGLLVVWFLRRVVGVDSTGLLLVALVLPPLTYLAVRRPDAVTTEALLGPVRAFRGWLASLGDVGTVVELGFVGAGLMWFTDAIVGVDSVPLLALEFVFPQLVYLILSRRATD